MIGYHIEELEIRQLEKLSKTNYNKKIFNENLSKPKQFWNRIKKCYHTKNKTSSAPKSFCIEGKLIHDKHLISDSFCSYVTGIGKSLQAKIINLSYSVWKFHNHTKMKRKVNPKNCSFNFKYVTPKDITNTIKNLNTSKSPGYDNIPVIFMKDGIHQLSKPLASLINKCTNRFFLLQRK